MLDAKLLRSDPQAVAANLARRGFTLDVAAFTALEERRKVAQVESDRVRAERNANAKAVGMAKGKGEDASALLARAEELDAAARRQRRGHRRRADRARRLAARPAEPAARVRAGRARRDRRTSKCAAGASRASSTSRRKDHVELGEKLGGLDFETAAKISGARFSVLRGGARAAAPRAGAVHARPAHARAWLHRGVRAVPRATRRRCRAPGSCRSSKQDLFRVQGEQGFYPDPDRRSAAHQPRARQHRRSRQAAAEARGAHAVLPLRGRRRRQGHARHDPPAPVREGRAGADREARGFVRRARRAHAATPRRCCRSSSCRIAWSRCARATSASAAPRPTTSKSGCRGRTATARSPRAATARRSRRGACRRAGAIRRPASPSRAHAQRLGRRGRPRAGRGAGELPERGRLDHRARRAAAVHGRRRQI